MTYTPPSVEVSSIANSRIINISEDVRIPVIVGRGPSERVVTDYPVTRGSSDPGWDALPHSGSTPDYITLTQVASYPGAGSTHANWSASYSGVDNMGGIYWDGTPGSTSPRTGETYYASYAYTVPSTQYDPQIFTDSKDVIDFYGSEDSATHEITTATSMALENGAPAVMCLQVQGSVASPTNWNTAFTKLKKKSNIAYLVPVSSGSAVQTSALQHCNEESSPLVGHERETILGLEGTSVTVQNLIDKAAALDDRRAILVAPGSGITRVIGSGTTLNLSGSYVAAALSGLITAQDSAIVPVTGKIITGFTIADDYYEPYEMNRLGNVGVCVMYSKSGVIKVRHALTTDVTSADTREISVVSADDLVRRITRDKLEDAYIGKGIVISASTPAAVAGTTAAIWNSLVRDGLIAEYGTKNDPTTGEVPISAVQDANEPTRINVAGSIRFLYPLNYISVEFFIYV